LREPSSRVEPVACAWLAFLLLHLALVLHICVTQTLWLVQHAATLPFFSRPAATAPDPLPPQRPTGSRAPRELLSTFLHVAGIETGYSYFAPNIPRSYDLSFDVELPDGRVEHIPVTFAGREERLRLFSLMDYLGRRSTGQLREVILKLVTYSVRQEYPDAMRVRAVVGTTVTPGLAAFRNGERASHQKLATYDFVFTAPAAGATE
jgi:hypothetical protein